MTRAAREPAKKIHARSADLSDQFRRAVESTALNLGEARWRAGKDRTNRYRYAAGSAQEAHTAIRLALAWGYLAPEDVREVTALLDRVMAMCWRLLHKK